MNKIFQYAAVTSVMLCLAGCQEYHIDSQPELPPSVMTDALDVYTLEATAPDRIVFNISSNTPWSIESDSQWCRPDPAMSASSSLVAEITVITEENRTEKSRTAVLSISAEDIPEVRKITVNQSSKGVLTVVPYDSLVDTEGEVISFTLISNKDWEIIPSTAFLSDIDRKRGEGKEDWTEETVSIRIPANPGSKREGKITVKTAFDEYVFTVIQNGVVIELEDNPQSGTINMEGDGTATVKTVKIRSNKPWRAEVPDAYQNWIKAEKSSESELRLTVSSNPLLCNRSGKVVLKTEEVIDGYEGVAFDVIQPAAVTFAEDSRYTADEESGCVRVDFSKGEMFRTNYTIRKGRTVIELKEMKMSAVCNLGFNFTSTTSNGNYKLHLEGNNTWWYRCAGSFGWAAPIKKPYTFEEVNAIRKIVFIVENDSSNPDKINISIFINDVLYGTQTGRTDIFAKGDAGCAFIFESGAQPAAGDYCIFKSITYIPEDQPAL